MQISRRSVLSNRLRNLLRRTAVSGLWKHLRVPLAAKVHLVSATKLAEDEFWTESLLGRSLARWREQPALTWSIAFENRRGLPWVYNRAIDQAVTADVLIFMHDDVWLADDQWIEKSIKATGQYDAIGVAGNQRRQTGQCTWAFDPGQTSRFEWDHPHLSGRIAHGSDDIHEYTDFGAAPARCELLDGVFLAANARVLRACGVRFDTRFSFHFYDLDFCRLATHAGLTLGTWPIDLIHASGGSYSSPSWLGMKQVFLDKWPD